VKSPNPAFAQVEVPLISSYLLSMKEGKEACVEPIITEAGYRFTVKMGKPKDADAAKRGTKSGGSHSSFLCLMSGTPMPFEYIRAEATAGRMGARLMAVVAEGERERVYLPPSKDVELVALNAQPTWLPNTETFGKCRVNIGLYGLTTWDKLFTPRQLVTLSLFSDLAQIVREKVKRDAVEAGLPDDGRSLNADGCGASAYSDSVALYLGLALSRFADRNNSLCTWDSGPIGTKSSTGGSARTASIRNLFARQAIGMAWDFAEANPFSDSGGSFTSSFDWIVPAVAALGRSINGYSIPADAAAQSLSQDKVVSTDPPYYDNIGYADLSDFFYVWLRRSLRPVFPELFATLAVPKAEELVATPYRHGSRQQAESFFLEGMTQAMHRLAELAHPAFPVSIYYAFKQSETSDGDGVSRSGWDTFLDCCDTCRVFNNRDLADAHRTW
jgi:putative DNA methylase